MELEYLCEIAFFVATVPSLTVISFVFCLYWRLNLILKCSGGQSTGVDVGVEGISFSDLLDRTVFPQDTISTHRRKKKGDVYAQKQTKSKTTIN